MPISAAIWAVIPHSRDRPSASSFAPLAAGSRATKANLSYPSCWFQSVPVATVQAAIPAGEGGQIPSHATVRRSCRGISNAVPAQTKPAVSQPIRECLYPYASISLTSVEVCPLLSQRCCDERVPRNAWEQPDLPCPASSRAPGSIQHPEPGFRREARTHLQGCGRGWNHHIQALTHSQISFRTQWFAFQTRRTESTRSRRKGRRSLYLPRSPRRKQKATRRSRSPQKC